MPESPLTIEPAAGRWREMLAPFPNLTAEQRRFREQLGLATDRPVILSGHQAGFWHPGILAKYMAAGSAAAALSADAAWLVVDQDTNDVTYFWAPVRTSEGLAVEYVSCDGDGSSSGDLGIAVCAVHPLWLDETWVGPRPWAAPSVGAGLARMSSALARHMNEPSAARQLAATTADLVGEVTAPLRSLFGSELHKTDLFNDLTEMMLADPERCIAAYNGAVAKFPRARIKPLEFDRSKGRFELPLWHIPPYGSAAAPKSDHGSRLRVDTESLPRIPRSELAPRALLMTGLMRLAACDMFVHGTGGGGGGENEGYDRITTEWFRSWRGDALAPTAVVTATLRLPIDFSGDAPDLQKIHDARALAHRASHDPALLGDAVAAARKRELVSQIAAAKQRRSEGADPAPLYRELHGLLETVRRDHRAVLNSLEEQARLYASRLDVARILADRTWPFPLYPDAVLRDLKARIDAEFEP